MRLKCFLSLLFFLPACAGKAPETKEAVPLTVPAPMPETFTGTWTSYYPNGQVEAVREMRDGKVWGAVTEYYQNGTVREKFTQIDGKLQGQFLRYHPNGDLELSCFYKDNLLDGTVTQYYESGNHIRSVQQYQAGKREGSNILYYRDGTIHGSFGFNNDKMEGDRVCYYPNGRLQEEILFTKSDRRSSYIVKFYYENGQLSETYGLINRLMEGTYLSYYEDGSLRRKGQFANGERVGDWFSYDREGKETVVRYD